MVTLISLSNQQDTGIEALSIESSPRTSFPIEEGERLLPVNILNSRERTIDISSQEEDLQADVSDAIHAEAMDISSQEGDLQEDVSDTIHVEAMDISSQEEDLQEEVFYNLPHQGLSKEPPVVSNPPLEDTGIEALSIESSLRTSFPIEEGERLLPVNISNSRERTMDISSQEEELQEDVFDAIHVEAMGISL